MGTRYSIKEVRGLVEGYAELREVKSTSGHGLNVLLHLADLGIAIRRMPPKHYHALLVHGLLRHSVRHAETILGISSATLHDRYEAGIYWIVRFLNEGDE